jgi:hypothetical protein
VRLPSARARSHQHLSTTGKVARVQAVLSAGLPADIAVVKSPVGMPALPPGRAPQEDSALHSISLLTQNLYRLPVGL